MRFYLNEQSVVMVRDDVIWFVPSNIENVDYQAYLAWVAEGNTAEEWTGN
jgi:hypothetical protein